MNTESLSVWSNVPLCFSNSVWWYYPFPWVLNCWVHLNLSFTTIFQIPTASWSRKALFECLPLSSACLLLSQCLWVGRITSRVSSLTGFQECSWTSPYPKHCFQGPILDPCRENYGVWGPGWQSFDIPSGECWESLSYTSQTSSQLTL